MHKVFCCITIYLQGCTEITLGIECWSSVIWWSGRFENIRFMWQCIINV